MCGIVGYIGSRQAGPLLVEGLERLSYRGYDSAGIAVMDQAQKIGVCKTKGKVERLKEMVDKQPLAGKIGIGHTRWATHGEPSDQNAHPHTDVQGEIAVVHNGIIENHIQLRQYLEQYGEVFVSQTDTEVIAHLLHHLYDGNMLHTLRKAIGMLEGSYALVVLCSREPDALYCVRNDNPLVMGFCDGEGFAASDVTAMLSHTRNVLFLKDKEMAVLSRTGVKLFDVYGNEIEQHFVRVDWNLSDAQKGGYPHYMLKEIFEQPEALKKTIASRNVQGDFSWFPFSQENAGKISKITIAACGTAYHAAVMGKYFIEELAHIPVNAEIASEYRYRHLIFDENELFIAVSQSGETADTLAALRRAKQKGISVLAICNAVGSSIAREAGKSNTLYTYAGPEIAVASTKAYLTQAVLMLMIAVTLGQMRGRLDTQRAHQLRESLEQLPQKAEETLGAFDQIQRLCDKLYQKKHVFFIGREKDWALSMEAALKLKEVSYIFSEAYAAGELKHGPLALLEDGQLVVAVLTQKRLAEKTINNLQEALSRGAKVVAVCTKSVLQQLAELNTERIVIPDMDEISAVLLAAIPLQMFAYCMAVARGCDVDQPRNLAKSVTVE